MSTVQVNYLDGIYKLQHSGHSPATLIAQLLLVKGQDLPAERHGSVFGGDLQSSQSGHMPFDQKRGHAAFQIPIGGDRFDDTAHFRTRFLDPSFSGEPFDLSG